MLSLDLLNAWPADVVDEVDVGGDTHNDLPDLHVHCVSDLI